LTQIKVINSYKKRYKIKGVQKNKEMKRKENQPSRECRGVRDRAPRKENEQWVRRQ
jgi:hypothetical protein